MEGYGSVVDMRESALHAVGTDPIDGSLRIWRLTGMALLDWKTS
jgi:hypothetical protein